jgi:dTDP-4-dehydrorhamnose reductase
MVVMKKFKIAITGLNGVLGANILHSIPKKLKKNSVIIDLYRSTKKNNEDDSIKLKHVHLDLMQIEKISNILETINPDFIIHLAAITHIDNCEAEVDQGNQSVSWKTNVGATKEIVAFCEKNSTHLIFLSTECIFSGLSQKKYTEKSKPNPKNWYGKTKAQAEELIQVAKNPWTIIRAVIAYDTSEKLNTIFSAIKTSFKKNKPFFAVHDQKFTPTYIPDIHKVIWNSIINRHTGILHVAPRKATTPYEFAIAIGKHFGYDLSLVKKQSMEKYFGLRRSKLRLKNACLDIQHSSNILHFIPRAVEQVLQS